MTEFGINLASEAHGPDELTEYAYHAENVGFDFAVISDHYHPWVSKQGNSPFVWGTIGAIAERTDELELGTAVTCPTMRIHPAIVAQAAATAQVQLDGRFFLGVGTGERLNEHILGDRWPPHSVRLEMLEEAVEMIRELWSGKMVTHHGDQYTVENAQLFTLPDDVPPIIVSGLGPRAAKAAGRIGDGYVATSPKEKLVNQFEAGGGEGPRYGGLMVSYAESDEKARRNAREWWPNAGLKGAGRSYRLRSTSKTPSRESPKTTSPKSSSPAPIHNPTSTRLGSISTPGSITFTSSRPVQIKRRPSSSSSGK